MGVSENKLKYLERGREFFFLILFDTFHHAKNGLFIFLFLFYAYTKLQTKEVRLEQIWIKKTSSKYSKKKCKYELRKVKSSNLWWAWAPLRSGYLFIMWTRSLQQQYPVKIT